MLNMKFKNPSWMSEKMWQLCRHRTRILKGKEVLENLSGNVDFVRFVKEPGVASERHTCERR